MIQKLKVECGLNQVNKMVQMIKDLTLSKDVVDGFKKQRSSEAIDGVTFGCEILTNGNWPVDVRPTCSIPASLKQCISEFEMYYKNKNQSRNLTWLYHNGQVELQTTFTQKKFQLICNVFQATILSFYNDTDSLSVQELKDKSNITEEFLKPALLQLCNPKIRLLDKAVKKPTFDDPNEQIKLNQKFTSNNIRVNLIPTTSSKKKETGQDAGEQQAQKEV